MFSLPPFSQPGRWFRGNLHTHTNRSDGRLAPAEVIEWHVDHGYDFVAITDHNVVTNPHEFSSPPSLLVIPAPRSAPGAAGWSIIFSGSASPGCPPPTTRRRS